jgi:hypothetical protein
MSRRPELALEFNAGADARIAGLGLEKNPYHDEAESESQKYWDAGWHDVDSYWGKWAKGPVLLLPRVRDHEAKTKARTPTEANQGVGE